MGKNSIFWGFLWGIAVFGMSCIFFLRISSFNAELQMVVGFFEKTSVRPRYGGVLEGFSKKNPDISERFCKKGAKKYIPPFLKSFLDSKFNVD